MSNQTKSLHIIHFNDAYHIEEGFSEPVAGAARFVTAVRQFDSLKPLVLFSGDIFNPSLMSTITKGKHMPPIMNEIGVHYSVYGNHDFDNGIEELIKLKNKTNCKWLTSNLFDAESGRPIADAELYSIVDWEGVRVGIIGVVEEDWLATLAFNPSTMKYEDFVVAGRKLAKKLKEEEGAEIVVALAHMRLPNDIKLAQQVEEIDLVLGGHDHFCHAELVNNTLVVKSGTEFRQLTHITVTVEKLPGSAKPKISFNTELVDVTSKYPPKPEVTKIVESFAELVKAKMEKPIALTAVELDARSSTIRASESVIGNFVADAIRNKFGCDMVILNSGTIRSDAVYPPGTITLGHLLSMFPFEDMMIVIRMKGDRVVKALENGVSKWPSLEGRFPVVSGFSFQFDPSKPPGSRVTSVTVKGEPIDDNKEYTVSTKTFLAQGRDGYDCMIGCPFVVDEENGQLLSCLIAEHFKLNNIIRTMTHHRHHSNAANDAAHHLEDVNLAVMHAVNLFRKKDKKGAAVYFHPIHPKLENRIHISQS